MSILKQQFEEYRAQIAASVAQNRAYPSVPYATFESWITSILDNVGNMINAAEAQNAPLCSAGTPAYPASVSAPAPHNTAIFEMKSDDDYFLK